MNGINYSSLMGNTGLFSNQVVNKDEALYKGAQARANNKAEDSRQTSADKDTYEYTGQSRSNTAVYERPKRTSSKEQEYKQLDSNGVQEGIKLSDSAQKLLKELRDKYGNMDIAVAEWSTDEEQDYYASKASKEYSVLINPELLEKMASDSSIREKYEAVFSGAGEKFETLKKELGEDADKIKGFSITMDKDGNVSYAVKLLKDMSESSKTQNKDNASKTQQERVENRRAERKKAEEERQEKIIKKREETEKIEADSIEELIAAIKAKLHPEQADNSSKDIKDAEAAAQGQAVTE